MPIATNPQTGETVFLDGDGAWKPAQTAVNPQTKEMLAHDGKDWIPVPAKSKGVLGYIDDVVRSLAQGATFGYADELAAKANSLLGSGTYDENLAAEQKRNKEISPAISIPGEIAGAVGGAVAAAPVTGTMAVASGISRLPGYARAIMGGGGAGALYGSGEAEPGHRIEGAVQGGAIGLAAGGLSVPIAEGARKLGQPVADLVRGAFNPEAEASRRVVTGLQRDARSGSAGLTPAEFAGAAADGQPVAIADIGGETTRALARDAANKSPEARSILNRMIDDRFEGQSERLSDWMRSRFNYPNAHAQQIAIENVANTTNRQAYDLAMRQGAGGVWDAELQRLAGAPAIQEASHAAIPSLANRGITEGFRAPRQNPLSFDAETGLASLATLPNGNRTVPDLRFWDQVKKNLDGMIGKAETQQNTAKVAELTGLKNELVSNLDRLAPSYARARAGAAHFFGAENALEAGQNFVSQNFNNDQVRQQLARMTPQERQLFQDGFASRLIDTINQVPDRRNVIGQIGSSEAAREKLAIALGPQRARELEAFLHIEGVMDRARGSVQGNSTTARQLIEGGIGGAGGYAVATGDIDPRSLLTAAFVGGAVRHGGQRIAQRIDQNVAARVADLLTSNDARHLNTGIQIVANRPVFLQALRNANSAAIAPMSAAASSQVGRLPQIVLHPQGPIAGRADEQPQVPGPPGQ